MAMRNLDVFRTSVAAAALGFARRALDEALKRAITRGMFRQTLADFQLTQAKLAQMATAVDAPRSSPTAPPGCATRANVTREAAMAKMTATEEAQRVIDRRCRCGADWARQRAAGRAALSRDPRAAHLRGRERGAAIDRRARAFARGESFTGRGVRPMRQEIR